MTPTNAERPVFSDGERLTARRLNQAFEHARDSLRRVLVGPLSPGVALGLQLTSNPDVASFTVSPGIALDRRGRVVLLASAVRYTRAQVEDIVGPLGLGDVVRVGVGLDSAASPLDPCAPSGSAVRERARLFFRKLGAQPPFTSTVVSSPLSLLSGFSLLFGNRVNVGAACVSPWEDLDANSSDPDGCSVQLGTLTAIEDEPLEVAMLDRQGIAPRFDALRNSYDQVVAEFRSREGQPRTYFVAPAGGTRVQATRIAADRDNTTPAATYSQNAPMVLELGGGTPTGSIPPGFAGVVALPVILEGSSVGLAPGTPLELVNVPSPPTALAVTRLGGAPNERLFGLVAGAPHSRADATSTNRVVVPVAVAGILAATIDAASGTVPANTPLTARDATVLRPAAAGDMVIARLAARVESGPDDPNEVPGHVFVVHPPYALASS